VRARRARRRALAGIGLGPAWRVGRAVAARPGLWPTAVRAGAVLVPAGWWRRRPFLPLPDPDYVHFRLVTAYGGDGTTPPPAQDVLTWLTWLRRFPR
jgi:hypothetical protein